MKKTLIATLQNLADNTLSDNSISNFMTRNLAANLDISTGAANARVSKLNAFGYAYTETEAAGVRVAITAEGRQALIDNPDVPAKARKQSKSGTKTKTPSNPVPEGYVLLKDFVKNAGAARRKLRSLGIDKPCSQWAWPAAEVDSIKEKLGEV